MELAEVGEKIGGAKVAKVRNYFPVEFRTCTWLCVVSW